MTQPWPDDFEVRERLCKWLAGEDSYYKFTDWLMADLWEMPDDAPGSALVTRIELYLFESQLTGGVVHESWTRKYLADLMHGLDKDYPIRLDFTKPGSQAGTREEGSG